jgi:hypothetical protein
MNRSGSNNLFLLTAFKRGKHFQEIKNRARKHGDRQWKTPVPEGGAGVIFGSVAVFFTGKTIVLLYDLSNLMPGFVGNRQLLTTLCPSGCQNPAPVGGCHSFTKTVLILSFSP